MKRTLEPVKRKRTFLLLIAFWLCLLPVHATEESAQRFLEHHDASRALNVLQGRIDSKPKDLEALRQIACVYLYFSNFKVASAYFSMALRLSPTDKQLHYWRGVCLYRLGKADGALKDFRIAIPEPSLPVLRCYVKLNRTADAAKTLEALLSSRSWANDDDIALCRIGRHYDRALTLVNPFSDDPGHSYVRIERAAILGDQEKWQASLDEYNSIAQLMNAQQRPAAFWKGRATALRALGHLDLAADDYRNEIAVLRKRPLTYCDRGVRYKDQQDLIAAYKNLAALERQAGQFSFAKEDEKQARRVQAEIDDHRRSFYTLGDILERPEEGLEQDPLEVGLSNAGWQAPDFSEAR
jgi:tetratricopeptide (TPR) repeat protein